MRETTYSEGGSVTPEMQYEFLKRYAHFEGTVGEDKYFTYVGMGKGFCVKFADGKPVQVIKMTEREAKTMVICDRLKFGE